jgi:hypothetical protein
VIRIAGEGEVASRWEITGETAAFGLAGDAAGFPMAGATAGETPAGASRVDAFFGNGIIFGFSVFIFCFSCASF